MKPILAHTVALLSLLLALAACGQPQPHPAPSATPSATNTLIPPLDTYGTVVTPRPSATATPTPTSTVTPTPTPSPIGTPEAGPEAYRLKPWDEAAAMQVLREAQSGAISAAYENLRGFYEVSLLSEMQLDFPHLRAEPGLNDQLADLKIEALSNFSSYALLHNIAVEPFRQKLERMLNDGSLPLMEMSYTLPDIGYRLIADPLTSTRLFDLPGSAEVIKVSAGPGWDYFVIHNKPNGGFSVEALYPQWERYWWSDEQAQLTDLNADGREEIAVTHDDWGTGMSHFCRRSFKLYQWDGSAFRNLMADPLEIGVGTDYGNCLDITFPANEHGGQDIVTSIQMNTLCPDDLPYIEQVTYSWDGQGFKKASDGPLPPKRLGAGRCAIDWALKAGPENETAVNILAGNIQDWPAEANADWGPAARDYFRLKLAAWDIRRGNLAYALKLLRQVRDEPAAPAYPLASRVAKTFLDQYAAGGPYVAAQAVDALYQAEMEKAGVTCSFMGCNTEKLHDQWGFAEPEWGIEYGYGFEDDFMKINALALALKEDPPTSLEALRLWLDRNGIRHAWDAEGDVDGKGDDDWLVEIVSSDANYSHKYLYIFLRRDGGIEPLKLGRIYFPPTEAPETLKWQSFRPDLDTAPENVLQIDDILYVFRFFPTDKTIQPEFDLDTTDISQYGVEENRVSVQSWQVEGSRLVAQYNGRQASYVWDGAQGKLIPTGFAPDLQEENVRKVEQALYLDNDPAKALPILNGMLEARIWENFQWGGKDPIPPAIKPYLQYLLGLAYERSGDPANAVRAYWQLWHDYPANPFSLAAHSKLERR